MSGALPPYPTATGVSSAVGSTGVYGSAGPSATGTGLTPLGTSVLTFKGGAERVRMGFGGLVGALIGAGVVLCMGA